MMSTPLAVGVPGRALGASGGRPVRWTGVLGEGATSRVLGALDEEKRPFAVKVGRDPSQARYLAGEALALASARCPSLVQAFGGGWLPAGAVDWADGELPFLSLGAVEGTSLAGCWAEWGAHEDLSFLFRDLAEALEELHGAGVAHGDVKPANVLVRRSTEGALRGTLIDLGLQADAGAIVPAGGTLRYLAPEVRRSEAGAAWGDGRARDLYAFALSFAEALVPELRGEADLSRAVEQRPLPEPYERLLRPLLAASPALRPSLRWLLAQAQECFGWGPEWMQSRRVRAVRREYLQVRREELRRAARAESVDVSVRGAPALWLTEALEGWRAAARLERASIESGSVELGAMTRHRQRRWLVRLLGPSAASFDWKPCPDDVLAERLLELAAEGPLDGVPRVRLVGGLSAQERTSGLSEVPSDPVALGLRLAELPVDERVLERIEALSDLPAPLGVAAARALRLRGEWARARLLASRVDSPEARLEGAIAARRLGDVEAAEAELARIVDPSPEVESHRAAQRARRLLDGGQIAEAHAACAGQVPTAPLLEVLALLALAENDPALATTRVEEGLDLAVTEEQRARLAAVSGMVAHAEARPGVAFERFRAAVHHAERAGAVLEEATYLTGVAAAAADRGEVGLALQSAERATLLFEVLGRAPEAARAALTRAAAYGLVGAELELREAASDALERARAAGDRRCEGYVHLVLSDGLPGRSAEAIRHAEEARRLLEGLGPEEELRAAARAFEQGLSVDARRFGDLARRVTAPEARLEWWKATAVAALEGRAELSVDEILAGLLELTAARELGVARGPAFVQGARLALSVARSDDARKLMAGARAAARALVAGTPEELRRHVQGLDWVALAEVPEGSQLVPEQLEEVESLVRSLGTRERLKPLLEQVLDALLLWTGVERGLLLLRAPTQGPTGEERLVVRAARNLAREDLQGVQLELSQSLARRALEKGAPVVAVDATGELPDMHRSVHALKLRSVLAVPLIARGETQGVVYLDDRVRRGAFGAAELAWVKLVATLAAVAIADARDQLRLRRAARKAERAEARMAASLARREVELELAERELGRDREVRGDYSAIVGRSEPMLSLLRVLDRVATSDVPVLVLGESGSGKELVARALHDNGPRRGRPFVAENCSAIPEPLLESTLFGHVRGAFTGAARQRAGLFEVAHGGTLFLDEVAEMPLPMQTKLLRVLQEGEVRPVGSERARKVDVRVVAATHRNLEERVAAGLFREDLYYRLNVVALKIPPLRDRRGDVPLLIQRFAEIHGQGRRLSFAPEALEALVAFSWPGNVRQLENEVRRLLVLTEGSVQLTHLSPEIQQAAEGPRALDTLHVRTRVDALERELVELALQRTEGNQTRAAELLGLSRFGLQKMMRRLEVGGGSGSRRGRAGRRSTSGLQESR